jgi:hypothetical protein
MEGEDVIKEFQDRFIYITQFNTEKNEERHQEISEDHSKIFQVYHFIKIFQFKYTLY